MKHTLVALMLVGAGCAHAEFYDGNKLLNFLHADNSAERLHGIGYIVGVADTMRDITHCPPSQNITVRQVSDLVTNYLVNTPSVRHQTADSIVIHVLKNTWPCQRSNNRGGGSL